MPTRPGLEVWIMPLNRKFRMIMTSVAAALMFMPFEPATRMEATWPPPPSSVIALVIVSAPNPPGSSASISPPAAVFEMAPAKVLQGAVRLHGLASSPTPEIQVRVACACAGAIARPPRKSAPRSAERKVDFFMVNAPRVGWCRESTLAQQVGAESIWNQVILLTQCRIPGAESTSFAGSSAPKECGPAGESTGSAGIPHSRVDSPRPLMEKLRCVGTGPPRVKAMPQGDPVNAPNLPSPSQDIIDKIMSVEGGITAQEALLLYTAVQTVRDGCIVEIGSYLGRSTAALALGTAAGFYVPVYAIDPHENFRGILASNFNFGPSDRTRFMQNMLRVEVTEIVRSINLSSEYITSSWPDAVGLLWVDGDHRYKAVKRDVACWLPHLRPDATIIFHDATNPQIGPLHVIEELLATGQWDRGVAVDKAVSLHRRLHRSG